MKKLFAVVLTLLVATAVLGESRQRAVRSYPWVPAVRSFPPQSGTKDCNADGKCTGWRLKEFITAGYETPEQAWFFHDHSLTSEQRATARIMPTDVERFQWVVVYQQEETFDVWIK